MPDFDYRLSVYHGDLSLVPGLDAWLRTVLGDAIFKCVGGLQTLNPRAYVAADPEPYIHCCLCLASTPGCAPSWATRSPSASGRRPHWPTVQPKPYIRLQTSAAARRTSTPRWLLHCGRDTLRTSSARTIGAGDAAARRKGWTFPIQAETFCQWAPGLGAHDVNAGAADVPAVRVTTCQPCAGHTSSRTGTPARWRRGRRPGTCPRAS